MTTKSTYTFILLMLAASLAFAQTGTINGSVKTADGNPAEMVSISIKGSNKGALSSTSGTFQIKNVLVGSQTIIASFVGLEKQEQTVIVKQGEAVTVNFVLKENSSKFQEVVISASRGNKINTYAAKMPLKNLENAQVYNSVPSEIIKQQGLTSYDDALRNVPGISRTWESTGRAGDGASYFALRGFEAQPALTNGLPGLTSGNLDLANVEEIQVLKGPSGTLFGASFYGYGGIINTITKKPYFDFGGEVAYNVGSFGLNRITADINTPLSKTEKVALRINTAYHTENSFQDAGFRKAFFVAPSLTYQVNDRLTFNFMAEILQEERAVAPVFFNSDRSSPLAFKNIKELNLNYNLSFMSNDLTIKNPRFNLQSQMTYKLSDNWTSQTVLSRGSIKSEGYYSYIYDDDVPTDNYFDQSFTKENQTTNTTDIQQNFNGDFKIGSLRNRLLIGLDYFNRNVIDNGSGYVTIRKVTPQQSEVTTDQSGAEITPVYLSEALLSNALAGSGASKNNSRNQAYSAYASDVINFTPALSGMASLRVDHFVSVPTYSDRKEDFSQTAFSPKFGLVYQPILDKVSVFANYMNAFFNVAPQSVVDAANVRISASYKPEHANQWEFGVKTNLFSDKLNATVSVYDIKVSDRVYPGATPTALPVQGGKVHSKGFEVDLNANPATGLNIIAGYSHNSIKIVEGNGTDFYNQPGRAPGGQGPANQANLWATYKFTKGNLKNFGLGAGGNYAGIYKVIDNSETGVFELPSYTLLNASLFYNADNYRVSLNVNNITSKQYYIGYWSVNPQRPRSFALSFAYKFK